MQANLMEIQNMQNIKNISEDANHSLISHDHGGSEAPSLTNCAGGFSNNNIASVFAVNPGGRPELKKEDKPKKKRKSPTYKSPKETPLYTLSFTILQKVDKILNTFTKDRKHTLGQRMLTLSLDLMKDVQMAWDYPEHRIEYLKDYLGNLIILEDLLQLCAHENYIKPKPFLNIFDPVEKAEKQAKGWYTSTLNAGVCNGNAVAERAVGTLKVDSDSPSCYELL